MLAGGVIEGTFYVARSRLLDAYSVGSVELRHVVHDQAVADLRAALDLDRVDRGAAQLHGDALRFAGIGQYAENPHRVPRLAEARPRDEEHVAEPLELDRAVDGKVGSRAGGERIFDTHF